MRAPNKFRCYYLSASAGILLLSAYPLFMGIRVIAEVIKYGAVSIERYPKYIIPYTPIALSMITGVLLMPLFFRLCRRFAFAAASACSTGVFFLAERLMETDIKVQTFTPVPLESWQMSLCYVSPDMYQSRTWEAVDILLGGYKPSFKLHFYIISLVIILTGLNCIYGFGQMILTGNGKRRKALILQSVSWAAFTGMCVYACFTAFYRTGELDVSPVSALLMTVFFVLFGITVGLFAASLTIGRKRLISAVLPAICACATVAVMYVGELILLSGHLFRLGQGAFFSPLPVIVLSAADLMTVLIPGLLTFAVCILLNPVRSAGNNG